SQPEAPHQVRAGRRQDGHGPLRESRARLTELERGTCRMDLRTLADFGEFLGGLGVIVSVVYLAIQIRGNTASVRSENYAHSLERMASMQEYLARDQVFTKIFNRGLVEP